MSAAEEMVFAMLMAYKQASGIKYIARLNDIGKYAAVGSTNSSVSAAVVRAYDRRKVVASRRGFATYLANLQICHCLPKPDFFFAAARLRTAS